MKTEPHVFVIFGGTGDLSQRKLLPALATLSEKDALGDDSIILCVGRNKELGDEGFRKIVREAIPDAKRFCNECCYYQPVQTDDLDSYVELSKRIVELERERGLPGNRVFYLALPPRAFEPTLEGLHAASLQLSHGWTRVVMEKPIGRDLESARSLIDSTQRVFREDQIYRIDHYLGKEMVQNLLVFRFANSIFESLWNRNHIESVQITVAESLGVEDRAAYYDKSGAVRDIVQNHLTQLVCLMGLEVPAAFDARSIRQEKVKLLRSISPISSEDVVFGRYERDGYVAGYLEENGVDSKSKTETYAAMRLRIDNWRWQGVPFYVRTGKRLRERCTRIAVVFRRPPISLFENMGQSALYPNVLVLQLQPNEGFGLTFDVKTPGDEFALQTFPLGFDYKKQFGDIPDAYSTLLLDVLEGDRTLFVHADEAIGSWKLFDPVLQSSHRIHSYPAGSLGPDAAQDLLSRNGHRWHEGMPGQ